MGPHRHHPVERARALETLDVRSLAVFAQALIPKLKAEVLVSGNMTAAGAEAFVASLPQALRHRPGEALPPRAPHPSLRVAAVPEGPPTIWVEDCTDSGNRNLAVELYWQLGATREPRESALLSLLGAVMEEPLFDSLRTKQQIGYVASCGPRDTCGVQGFSIWLLSSTFGAVDICRRVGQFLQEFRQKVVDMPAEDFSRHVVALASQFLEPDRTIWDVQSRAGDELRDRCSMFDRTIREAVELATLTKEDVLRILDESLLPGAPKQRLVIVVSIGGLAKATRSSELEAFREHYPGVRVVSSPTELWPATHFHDVA